MKTKLWLFLTAFSLVFSACEKDAEFRGGPPGSTGSDIENLNDANCLLEVDDDGIAETRLVAGRNQTEVGTVTVKVEDGNIVVTYTTKEDWLITETHLHIAADFEGFPTGGGGNPQIGNFDYSDDYHDDDLYTDKVTYTIPKGEIEPAPEDGEPYYIAAHAVVVDGLSVFSEISGKAQAEVSQPVADAESYFPNVSVSSNLINGDFNGWCLEVDKEIRAQPYTFDLFSSYRDLPSSYSQEFLNKVNWILNERFQDKEDYTHGDVQMAIWVLLTGKTNLADARGEEPRLDCEDEPTAYLCGRIPFDDDNINNIVSQAIEEGSDFVPECGGVFAILLINEDIQDIIIEYPVPCGETAWGEGCFFNDKSWAMYFKVKF